MLERFEKYKTVFEVGNITKAAQILHISQPALTISIKELEKELKCKLLVRSRTGVRPTEEGTFLYEEIKKLLNCKWNIITGIKEIKKEQNEIIRFGLIDNIALVSGKALSTFSKEHPQVYLKTYIDNSERLIKMVDNLELDFAIITRNQKQNYKSLKYSPFIKERFNLVFKSDLDINHKNFTNHRFISYNKDSNTHKLIAEFLGNNQLKFQNIIYSSSPEFSLQMVLGGNGISLLPTNLVKGYLHSGELKTIIKRKLEFYRSFDIVTYKDKLLTAEILELISIIKNSYK